MEMKSPLTLSAVLAVLVKSWPVVRRASTVEQILVTRVRKAATSFRNMDPRAAAGHAVILAGPAAIRMQIFDF
jgi:hypothetical protein